ncbi:GNAT family N-acetyltransferase [Betaproteobacteria bacterium GR16-43]|nr:GNAT family N-acetyltransferase [Betaproteobacteria bacterium GR16-43]
MTSWRICPFDDLTPREVHDIYQARVEVFVLEQECPFQDVDGADPQCWHLFTRSDAGALVAYCRIVPPGLKFTEPSIGRVLTTDAARRTGLGRVLMAEAVKRTKALWPDLAIRIGAQARLEKFYNDFGFEKASDMYMEDGIPHIEMVRP